MQGAKVQAGGHVQVNLAVQVDVWALLHLAKPRHARPLILSWVR
jgi:hypothetical protein